MKVVRSILLSDYEWRRGLAITLWKAGILAIAASCGSNDGSETLEVYDCEIREELLGQSKSCLGTYSCPCGSRCEFGRCVSDCNDCGDTQSCTAFGYCAESDSRSLDLPDAGSENFFVVSENVIIFAPEESERVFTVRRGNAGEDLEIEIGTEHPNFRVGCDLGSQVVQSTCRVSLSATRAAVPVRVVRLSELGQTTVPEGELDAFSAGVGPVVTVASKHLIRAIPIEVEVEEAVEMGIQPGRYTGLATLTGFAGNEASDDFAQAITMSVTVIVGELDADGRWPISIVDAAGVFSLLLEDDRALVAGFLESNPGGDEDDYAFASRSFVPYISGSVGIDEFTLAARVSNIRFINTEPGRLRFGLTQAFAIVESDDHDLEGFWNFALERDGSEVEPPALVLETTGWTPVDYQAPLAIEAEVLVDFEDNLLLAAGNRGQVEEIICGDGGMDRKQLSGQLAIREVTGVSTDIATAFYDGEVYCESVGNDLDVSRWPVFPIFEREGQEPALYQEVILGCIDELEPGFVDPLRDPECIDLPRWLAAMERGFERARNGTALATDELVDQRLGAYLLTRYLDLNGSLAHMHSLERSIQRYLRPDQTGLGRFPSLVAMTRHGRRAWDPILHPRTLKGVLDAELPVHSQPDYRVALVSPSLLANFDVQNDIHTTPPALAIASDIADQGQVWRALAREIFLGRLNGFDLREARAELASAVRRSVFLYLVASYLQERTEDEQNGELEPGEEGYVESYWENDWTMVARRLTEAVTEVGDHLSRRRDQRGELSLPWNRIGDQVGAGARFRAMSEMMLGSDATLGGVLGFELQEGDRLRDAAFRFYDFYRADALNFQRINNSVEDRLDYLATGYGKKLVELCGYVENEADPAAGYRIFDDEFGEDIVKSRCFVVPECREDIVRLDNPAVAMQRLCRVARVSSRAIRREQIPVPISSLTADGRPELRELLLGDDEQPNIVSRTAGGSTLTGEFTFRSDDGGDDFAFAIADLENLETILRTQGESTSLFAEAEFYCEQVYRDFTAAENDDPAICNVEKQAESAPDDGVVDGSVNASGEQPATCALDVQTSYDNAQTQASCYRGEIGVAYQRVLAEQASLKLAQAKLQQLFDEFVVKSDECEIKAQLRADIAAQYTTYLDTVGGLRDSILNMNKAVATINTVADCLDAALSFKPTTGLFKGLISLGAGAAGIAMQCAGSAVYNGANAAAEDFSKQIDAAKDTFGRDRELLEQDTEVALCFNSLNTITAKLEPANASIRSALAGVQESISAYDQLLRTARQIYEEGRTWKANVEKRRITSLPQTFDFQEFFLLLDGRVERIQSALLFAGRAVEFELQQSLFDEEEVLSTFDLDTLRNIALELKDRVVEGRVSGGAPVEGRFVLSLRRDILSLPDSGTSERGFHSLDDTTLMREALLSPRHALYSTDGTYLGQNVPFSLSPFAVGDQSVGLEDFSAGLLCAERIWSVGAVVIGKDAVAIDASRLTPLYLRKRNKFFVQACTPDARTLQGFIGPASGVFAYGTDAAATPDRFTSAWLNARVERNDLPGPTRAALERRELTVGLTQEFAGLGLYGDYELFIPAETFETGRLNLDGVKDIYLVLDVVAVTNNSRL